MNNRIIHLTTVHPFHDNRIFEKYVRSCAAVGFDTHYIAMPPNINTQIPNGVRFHALPTHSGVLGRLHRQVIALRIITSIGRSIVHFHDPELQPLAWLLQSMGHSPIYDIHEDNTLAIRQKDYIPLSLRPPLCAIMEAVENHSHRVIATSIAERCYEKRFPLAVKALNYPTKHHNVKFNKPPTGNIRLLYTGVVSLDRGAENMIRLLRFIPNSTLTIVGSCSNDLQKHLKSLAGNDIHRLILNAPSSGLCFSTICETYNEANWSAGLALFPPTPHYYDKELTKLFEYMSRGIPVICSNFPAWNRIVVDRGAGMTFDCTDPRYPMLIQKALTDSNHLVEMGNNGLMASSDFTWNSEFSRIHDLYTKLSRHL